MKKEYVELEINIIEFKKSDIITMSNPDYIDEIIPWIGDDDNELEIFK